jgi:hypothetical protein
MITQGLSLFLNSEDGGVGWVLSTKLKGVVAKEGQSKFSVTET